MRTFLKKTVNGFLGMFNLRITGDYPFVCGDLSRDLRHQINKTKPVCLDVGANIGQTIELLSDTFVEPDIYAFEPSTETFRVLQSKKFGKNVRLYNKALGKEEEKREFINYSKPCLSSFLTLGSDSENPFRDTAAKNREVVQMDTVDQFLRGEGLDVVDLLKIDTQGFDYEVLSGARESMRQGVVKNVLVEINFVKLYDGQCSPEDIFHILRDHGLYLIDYYEKIRQNNTIAWCTALFGRR